MEEGGGALPQPSLLLVVGGESSAEGGLAGTGPAGRLLADLNLQEGKYFTNLKPSKAPLWANNMSQIVVAELKLCW